MRIQQLDLVNFRCFKEASFVFSEAITFCCGLNFTGKSSIANAIEWAVTGRTRGTDARGAGSKTLVRLGEAGMAVTLTDTNGETLTRAMTSSGMKANPPEGWNVNPDVFRILVDGAALLDMNHKDAKDLLLRVLNVKVPLSPEKSVTLAQLDMDYEQACDRRKIAKGHLNGLVIPAMPEGEVPDIDALEAKLGDLRKQAHDREIKTAKGDGRRAQAEKELARATKAVGSANFARNNADIPIDLDSLIASIPDHLSDAKALSARQTDLEAKRVEAQAIKLALKTLYAARETIAGHNPSKGCVLNADIPCKTPAIRFAGQRETFDLQIQEQEQAFVALSGALEQLEQATDQDRRMGQMATGWRQMAEKRDQLAKAVTAALEEQEDRQNELNALPAEAEVPAELVTLRERIANGERVVREARELVRQRIAHEDATTARQQAAQAVATIEATVERLGPKGLRVEALAASLGVFEDSINRVLAGFGYHLVFNLDPWQVVVNGRNAELLSASERLRVGVSIQCALAVVTDLNFVIVDGADMLDEPGRASLGELLSVAPDTLQVIVLATRSTPLPRDAGWGTYWLERESPDAATKVSDISRLAGAVA